MSWPTSQELAHYTCYRTAGPLTIDGKLDEPSWKLAPRSGRFVDIVTGKPAWFDTRVAILWDDTCLYFGFTAEETNVCATLTQRDSRIYEDNDLEVFIAGRDAYYEFEINALNTIYEVFWIWKDIFRPGAPYFGRPEFNPAAHPTLEIYGIGGHVHPRGERWGFLDWDFPGLRHAVHVEGVLNKCAGTDQGWSAELAFPWKGLELLADGRSLPPQEGDMWRIDCSRFQQAGPDSQRLDPSAGWTWNRHGHYDSHIPETFTHVHFSTQVVGKPSEKR
ncbi:MAG TPA: carbohydrate-binding family 9-like protein [Terriglobia bacterium]|nr:carbohydrate-binding family 9-like protein [Terriglobia bacterium]